MKGLLSAFPQNHLFALLKSLIDRRAYCVALSTFRSHVTIIVREISIIDENIGIGRTRILLMKIPITQLQTAFLNYPGTSCMYCKNCQNHVPVAYLTILEAALIYLVRVSVFCYSSPLLTDVHGRSSSLTAFSAHVPQTDCIVSSAA